MAEYNPSSKKLTRQKAHRKSAIKRSTDSYWDLATAGSGAYAVADTAGAISSLTSSYLKFESAITPSKQAYQELNVGRKTVGLDEQEYSMWDIMKGGPKATDIEKSWTDMETTEPDATAVQQGHQYNVGELKNIGREVMAGTASGTLDGNTWQDVTGKSLGTRPKYPIGEVKTETPVIKDKEPTVKDMSKTDTTDKSLLDSVGDKLKSNVNQDTSDPNAAVAAPDLSSGTEDVITEHALTPENDPMYYKDRNMWQSQYASMNKATQDRNKDSTKFSDIEQKGINEAYRMGGNDFDKASEIWGTSEWLENMQQYK